MSKRKLKVYGGDSFVEGRQVRMFVAARSQKAAREATGVDLPTFRGYWCESGIEEEGRLARACPGVPFYRFLSGEDADRYHMMRD